MTEDVILEIARWVREAEVATIAKMAALQLGEAFESRESDNDHE